MVVSVAGGGLPPITTRLAGRVGQSLGRISAAQVGTRSLTLSVLVQGSSEAALAANLEALTARLTVSKGGEIARVGRLQQTLADGSTLRYLECAAVAGMSRSRAVRYGPHAFILPVQFLAAHGLWYDPAQQTATATVLAEGGGGLEYPFAHPFQYGTGEDPQAVFTVSNGGDAETESIEWSIPGPVTGPELHSVTLSRALRFPGLVVPALSTFVVKMGWQPGAPSADAFSAVVVDSAGGETDVIGYLGTNSRRFWLEPGDNVLLAVQSNAADTVHTIKHYREYLGAGE